LSEERKQLKRIQVPDGLISNQHRKDGIKIQPKLTYLYVCIKILQQDFGTNILGITPKELKEYVGWKKNETLKGHLVSLKELGYISFQDEYEQGKLKPNQKIIIHITAIKDLGEYFKELYEISIKEKILKATDEPEKAVRLCYMIKCYTHKDYGYCWLTFKQFEEWGNIRQQDLNSIIKQLEKAKLLHVTRGSTFKDTNNIIRTENNKYELSFN
jgi:hypothetical protein